MGVYNRAPLAFERGQIGVDVFWVPGAVRPLPHVGLRGEQRAHLGLVLGAGVRGEGERRVGQLVPPTLVRTLENQIKQCAEHPEEPEPLKSDAAAEVPPPEGFPLGCVEIVLAEDVSDLVGRISDQQGHVGQTLAQRSKCAFRRRGADMQLASVNSQGAMSGRPQGP